ncbi:MAG: uroporphyrinogen-III synthase [Chlamydiales bacterium]|jgi:uroporphyrinogen-III synthase
MHEKKILYLGLDPSRYKAQGDIHHFPVIHIVARSGNSLEVLDSFKDVPLYTHMVFTSRNAARIFFETHKELNCGDISKNCIIIAVGKATASLLVKLGFSPNITAISETAEGVVQALSQIDLSSAFCFWPHSSLSRPLISDFFLKEKIRFKECSLYDTLPVKAEKIPDLKEFKEIIFTSPSTVDAFLQIFPKVPEGIKITPIGPVTEKYLSKVNRRFCII